MTNESISAISSMSFETTTDPLLLAYILPVASIVFAAVIVLSIYCILKRIKIKKSKYKTSEIPRTQSTVSGDYEEYGTDFPSTGSEITENMNYVPNCTSI